MAAQRHERAPPKDAQLNAIHPKFPREKPAVTIGESAGARHGALASVAGATFVCTSRGGRVKDQRLMLRGLTNVAGWDQGQRLVNIHRTQGSGPRKLGANYQV